MIVVCNACTDHTATVAASFSGVTVIDSDVPSKTNALNMGNDRAQAWPRIYLDADITSTAQALMATADALDGSDLCAARPTARFETSGASPVVKAYYRARATIPSLQTAMWGAGVYALSERGFARLGRFPDVKGDDLWVDRLFASSEKAVVSTTPVEVHVPKTFAALVAITRRNISGAHEPSPGGDDAHDAGGTLGELLTAVRSPRNVLDAVVYVFVALSARLRLGRRNTRWERDDTSRS